MNPGKYKAALAAALLVTLAGTASAQQAATSSPGIDPGAVAALDRMERTCGPSRPSG